MVPCDPIIAAFVAAGTAATTSVFHRSLAKRGMSPALVALTNSLLGAILLILVLPSPQALTTIGSLDLILLFASSVLWAYAVLFDIRSLVGTTAADSSLLSSLRFIMLLTVGVTLFGESIAPTQAAGLLLIVFGTLYGVDLSTVSSVHNGLLPKLKSLFCAVAALSIDRILVLQIDPTIVIQAGYIGPTIVYLIMVGPSLWHSPISWKPIALSLVIISSVFYALSGYYLIHSLRGDSMNYAVTVYETRTIIVLILAAIFLHEREQLKAKSIASIITLLGAVLVTAGA